MSESAVESFSITRQAIDPRADGGTRVVHVSAKQIVIERAIEKVRMKVVVPVAAYQDLVLRVRLHEASASLILRHEDHELDVTLASGDAIEVAKKAKAWGAVFGRQARIEEACIAIREPFARRTKRAQPKRRSAFSRRRKVGIVARQETSFSGEREIIART